MAYENPYLGRTGDPVPTYTNPRTTRTTATANPYTYAAGRGAYPAISTSTSGTARPAPVGSSTYTAPSYTAPSITGRTATSSTADPLGTALQRQSNYNPTATQPTGAMPQGYQTPQLQSMISYWNQYAPANNQGNAISQSYINPDGTISYSFGGGQWYTKAPQDFNAMLKTMGTYTNQVTGGAVPLYTGQYAPTNVPGQYYGGSSSQWSPTAANLSYTPTQPISPYGSTGNPGTPGLQSLTGNNQMLNFMQSLLGGGGYGNMYGGSYNPPQYIGVGGNQSRYNPYQWLMQLLTGGGY